MLDSAEDKKREAFRAAVERFLEDGLSPDDMASMITAAAETKPSNGSVPPAKPEDVMYEPGNLPEGLIDLPSAAKRYGIRPRTLYEWVKRGKLPKCGRVRAKAPGGGYILTVEAEIVYCRDNPQKRGRKKSVYS